MSSFAVEHNLAAVNWLVFVILHIAVIPKIRRNFVITRNKNFMKLFW